jgi:N-acetylmuramoyl-L-alanine amidase
MASTSLIRLFRLGTPWILLFSLFFLCPTAAYSQALPAGDRVIHADDPYSRAKDFHSRLEQDPKLHNSRTRWLEGVRNFRRLYLANRSAKNAPACLYMMAKMYRRMYEIFGLSIDLDESLATYRELAANYPRSTLADDALLYMAEIELKEKDNPTRAAELYRKILKKYPRGDMGAQALAQLGKLSSAKHASSSHAATTQTGTQDGSGSPESVRILPLQHWSSNDYTRIVVRASAPVDYTARLLEKNNNLPRRLFIDLNKSFIPEKDRSTVPIQDGLLKQISMGQLDSSKVRVALDIESISDYKIYSLKDPFRLIIDVHGNKKKNPSPPPEKQEQTTQRTPLVQLTPTVKKRLPELKNEPPRTRPASGFLTLQDNKKIRPADKTTPGLPDETTAPLSLAQQLGLGVQRIVIDPGHGGKDPGAMAHGLKEKNITLAVAEKAAGILKKQYNYDVVLTRQSDTYISLEERTAIANTNNADLFVSIHVNAHPRKTARGVETFFLNLATNTEAMRVAARENATSTHNISELQSILADLMQNAKIRESSQLAEFVQTSLVSGLEQHFATRNLGVKQAPFYVLIGASMPAVLAEISFITNPDEAKRLKSDAYLRTIAEQIAQGIVNYVEYRRSAALHL